MINRKSFSGAVSRAFKDHLTLAEFAQESGLSKSAILGRAKRNQIGFRYIDTRQTGYRKGQRLYWVGDIPEASGSAALINYLSRTAACEREYLRELDEALSRVMQSRRVKGVTL